MKKRRANGGGFSLVEVALALGVASFALVAVISLCATSFATGKGDTDDTLIASMSSNVVDDFRRQAFSNTSVGTTTATAFFSVDGFRLQDASGNDLAKAAALAAGAVYECDTTVTEDATTKSADGTINLRRLLMTFKWPAQSAAPPNVKYVHATVANY